MRKPQPYIFLILLTGIFSCSKPRPLFEKLKGEDTGIRFKNNITDTGQVSILDYLYYYNGAGVAAGDINNDGWIDLYFASNQESPKLYLNKGNWKFEDITEKAGFAARRGWTTGVSMADVNGDGWLDIYISTVANHTIPNGANKGKQVFTESQNQLYINNGNNSFTDRAAEWGVALKGYSTQAAFFDYDKDGDLDLLQLQHSIHQTDTYGDTSLRRKYSAVSGCKLFRNEGRRFTDITAGSGLISSALGYGLGIAIGDLNQDGWEDIYIGNDFHENDYYYLNKGSGKFEEINRQAFGHESNFSMGNDIADINNDGWPDIITLDMLPQDEKVLKSSAGDDPYDVYQYQRDYGYYYQYARNCLQLNTGAGLRFTEIALFSGLAATDWSWSALVNDYDLDGRNDIFISNGIKGRMNDLDYSKFIGNDEARASGSNAGNLDKEILKKQPGGQWHNYLFRGSDSLQFEDVSATWGMDAASLSNGALYADLDNDGDPDLVTNDMNAEAGVYRNTTREGGKKNYLSLQFVHEKNLHAATGVKAFLFNRGRLQFKYLQPVRGFMSSVDTRLIFGLDTASRADSLIIIWPDNRKQVILNPAINQILSVSHQAAADSLTDQAAYIRQLLQTDTAQPFTDISANIKLNYKHRENFSFVDFNRQWFIPRMLSTAGPKLAVADVNGDGLDDFYVCGAKLQAGELFIQQADLQFSSANQALFRADSACEDVDAVFLDVDNDQDPDLYVASGGNEYWGDMPPLNDRLYLNDGKGNFTKSAGLPALFENKSCVRPCDFDGDKDLDLFIGGRANSKAYGEIPQSFLLENDGRGNFTVVSGKLAKTRGQIGMITDAAWMDLEKDGRPDLVVVGEWMRPTVFRNNGQNYESVELPAGSGWWSSITAADLNNDGYNDLLLGNYGLNSKITASAAYPLQMYVGDIDNNGNTDQILALAKYGEYYTFAGKEYLERQLPFLKKEYLSYSKMAGKTVKEIFGDKLNKTKLMKADDLASCILLNNGQGGFTRRPMPAAAQWSPQNKFLVQDFNADGRPDLLAGAGFFGVNPYEGRYDALPLCYYTGNSSGSLTPIFPTAPALQIQGEVRDIQPIRLAGKRRALVVARNNEGLVFLEY